MKIVFVICSLETRGGTERITIDRANSLVRRGYEVCFIVFSGSGKTAYPLDGRVKVVNVSKVFDAGCTLRSNPVKFLYRYFKWRISLQKAVQKAINEINPDIVSMLAYHPLMIKTDCPLVLESHCMRGTERRNPVKEFDLSRLAGRADAVVALTMRDAAEWKEARRVEVIPNFTKFSPAGVCDYSAGRVMAVGRLEMQKGFDILVDAWKTVRECHSDWTLDIFGDGGERAALQAQIEHNGLVGSVNLRGSNDEIDKEYARHSVFVLSSRYEGFALVLLEAMSCGVACVSFDCPAGPSVIIEQDENGLLIPFEGLSREEQIRKLAEGINYMIEHPDRRRRMGKRGRESVRRFSQESIMEKWEKLYIDLIGNRRNK